MKFGKRLLGEMCPQWGWKAYVHYAELKAKLKELGSKRREVPPPADTTEAAELLASVEIELDTVSAFFAQQEQSLRDLLATLSAHPASVTEAAQGEGGLKAHPDVAEIEATKRAYCDLQALKRYAAINVEGFQKFHKKFQKHSDGRTDSVERSIAILQRVEQADIATHNLDGLGGQFAGAYAKRWTGGNVEVATEALEGAWRHDPRSQPRVVGMDNAAFFRKHSMRPELHYVLRIISGTSNLQLAQDVAECLNQRVEGTRVSTFANGEIEIKLLNNVRGDDVFVVQPNIGMPGDPRSVNKSCMELLLLIHTLRLASAKRINAVIPYMAYSRQDRKTEARVPISCSAYARMMITLGVDRVVTVDLHCGQIQGFFGNTPVDNLSAEREFVKYLQDKGINFAEACVVSPDAGGVARARQLADDLPCDNVVTILKRRAAANQIDSMQIVGDVRGKTCIIIDDIIDTAGTLVKACQLLKEHGASTVIACATHGLLTHPACDRVNACSSLEEVIVTDSVPQHHNLEQCPKLRVLTIAPLLAECINRVHREQSLSVLFHRKK
eukprot:TRINITY_DN42702_c0_g1_i1.p1 TRINITY_DN42702_c0_g1~~TRINITY_DN42702_c0_g1_i1.p1  ORF type:complete len:566 (-),score=97.19 TRINITY_DN42702_c0_g1_i1:9-1673(-)